MKKVWDDISEIMKRDETVLVMIIEQLEIVINSSAASGFEVITAE